MDYLRSVLGMGKSKESPSSAVQHTAPEKTANEAEKIETDRNNSSQVDMAPTMDKLDTLGQNIREAAKKVIPLKDDDCLSCKLIGTTVLYGSSVFILGGGLKYRKTQTGFLKVSSTLACSSLAFAMFLLGTARLFDLSVFDPTNKKNMIQLIQEDIDKIGKYFTKK